MSPNRSLPMIAILLVAALGAAPLAHAGLTDALKKKITDKVGRKTDEKMDQVLDGKQARPAEKASEGAEAGGASGPRGAGGSVSAVSTKFDFVPGDSVLFMDDFTDDDLGEFPARWKLVGGTFEVAEREGQRWLRCVSHSGSIRMKGTAPLPEFWTLEFDFYNEDASAIALTLDGHSLEGTGAWQARYPYSSALMSFNTGGVVANTPFEGDVTGLHHVALMGRGAALKIYVDQQRMVSVPDVTGPAKPAEIEIQLGAPSRPMITNVRYAAGCRPARDLLAEGRLVTHGIRFETGSDVVLPESAPILRQVAAWLEAHPAAKLKVTGHTDNVGTAASNLDLSKRRAASVAKVLSTEFKIASDRFATDGLGDSKTIASNAKPEGRAMNRRVEFAKL